MYFSVSYGRKGGEFFLLVFVILKGNCVQPLLLKCITTVSFTLILGKLTDQEKLEMNRSSSPHGLL